MTTVVVASFVVSLVVVFIFALTTTLFAEEDLYEEYMFAIDGLAWLTLVVVTAVTLTVLFWSVR